MNDEFNKFDTPEINEGAKIIRLGQSLIKLKNSLEYVREEAEASIKNAEALGRTEIATEAQEILVSVKTLQEKLKNPHIQEWTAAQEEVPF